MNALMVVCGLGFISLLAEIANLKKRLHIAIISGLIIALGLAIADWNSKLSYYNNMLVFDQFSLTFTLLIIAVSIFWFFISSPFFVGQAHQTDRSALVVFTMVGGIMMVSFHNMAMLFLGIEILSISLYVLAGSNKESFISNEAAFKYFIMGSFATGFLLMGIALIYGATGSFDIGKIADYIAANSTAMPGFFYVGVLLMLIGMTFKISAVPFHFWAPDVYAGSPTIITALMSTVVKIAAVAAFYKIFGQCFMSVQAAVVNAVEIIVVLTLIVANVTAVYQNNVKRMLAYSSIAHIGYVLLAFISGGVNAEGTFFYYLLSYSAASLAAFGILSVLESSTGSTSLDTLQGLFQKNPFAASCMTIAMLSLAGIPPLAGFFAKYMILGNAIGAGHIYLTVLAIITSLVGVYYYFRPIVAMFTKVHASESKPFSNGQKLVIGLLALITLLAGIMPEFLINLLG
jgi:NADH-quinone oxidoreductase subunit N